MGSSFLWIVWTIFPLILQMLQLMPPYISWWRCPAQFVPRREHNFWIRSLGVSISLRILFRVFGWVKVHRHCSIEFEVRGSEIWVLERTWERSTFWRVYVAVFSRFSASTILEATILAKILDAAGPDTSVVSLHGRPHVLAEAFASYLGNGFRAKLVEYPTFDLRLLKRCLQRISASLFGSLDPFPMTEFVVNRLKGAASRDWMAPPVALLKAIITNDMSMPGLVDVVATIVGVWPLMVLYIKRHTAKTMEVALW